MGSENHTDATFTGFDISHQMPGMFHPVETVLVPPLFPDLLYRHVLGALDKDSPHGELAVALRRHADDLRSLARESRYVLMGVRRDVDGLRDRLRSFATPEIVDRGYEECLASARPGNSLEPMNPTLVVDLIAAASFFTFFEPELRAELIERIVPDVSKTALVTLFVARTALTKSHERRLGLDSPPGRPPGADLDVSLLDKFAATWSRLDPVSRFLEALPMRSDIVSFEKIDDAPRPRMAIQLEAPTPTGRTVVVFSPRLPVEGTPKDDGRIIEVDVPEGAIPGPVLVLPQESKGAFVDVEKTLADLAAMFPRMTERSILSALPLPRWAYPLAFAQRSKVELANVPNDEAPDFHVSLELYDGDGARLEAPVAEANQVVTIRLQLSTTAIGVLGSPSVEAKDGTIEKEDPLTYRFVSGKPGAKLMTVLLGKRRFPFYITVILRSDAPTREECLRSAGSWANPLDILDIVAVHAVVLHTGKVLYFSFSKKAVNDKKSLELFFNDPNAGDYQIWDPVTGVAEPSKPVGRNVFCAGQCQLEDGMILAAGGQDGAGAADLTKEWDKLFAAILFGVDNGSHKDVHTYDPIDDVWKRWPDMHEGRYYPTVLTLPNGAPFIAAGLSNLQQWVIGGWAQNDSLETYNPAHLGLGPLAPRHFMSADQYPILRLLPGSRHIFVHIHQDSRLFDLASMSFLPDTFRPPHPVGRFSYPMQTGHALLPQFEGDLPRILVVGGSTSTDFNMLDTESDADAVKGGFVFEYDRADPSASKWRKTIGEPAAARLLCDLVLLPDGKVFVVNGIGRGAASGHSKNNMFLAEIFDPKTEEFRTVAAPDPERPRAYHSTAVLLPDARVAIGSHTGTYNNPNVEGEPSADDTSIQIYNPPYLSCGERPAIKYWPREAEYGAIVTVGLNSDSPIGRLILMRPCAVTHSVDMDQRAVWLKFDGGLEKGFMELTARIPTDAALLPPGYYMLFAVTDSGIPSISRWVRIRGGKPHNGDGSTVVREPANLGSFDGGAHYSCSAPFDGDVYIEKIDQHSSVDVTTIGGSIIVAEKIDQHSYGSLTASGSITIGQKIEQHSQGYLKCDGMITIGQKISEHSQARLEAGLGVLIGEKIDQHCGVTIIAHSGDIRIGQKIDGHSTVSCIAHSGNIRILEKIGGDSIVELHAPLGVIEIPKIEGNARVRWKATALVVAELNSPHVERFF